MKITFLAAISLMLTGPAAFAETAIARGNSYATAISNYCLAKSYLPFTDSLKVCLSNAKANARAYVRLLNDAKNNAHNAQKVVADIEALKTSLVNQTTVVGIPLDEYVGTADIKNALIRAQNDATAGNTQSLLNRIQYSKQVLTAFEGSI